MRFQTSPEYLTQPRLDPEEIKDLDLADSAADAARASRQNAVSPLPTCLPVYLVLRAAFGKMKFSRLSAQRRSMVVLAPLWSLTLKTK